MVSFNLTYEPSAYLCVQRLDIQLFYFVQVALATDVIILMNVLLSFCRKWRAILEVLFQIWLNYEIFLHLLCRRIVV